MAMKKEPGRALRNGISLKQLVKTYSTEAKVEQWFPRSRGARRDPLPRVVVANVQTCRERPATPFRRRAKACSRPRFGTKAGKVMEGSKLGYQDWIIAM